MVTTAENTAKKLPETEGVAEPSMEEILASIKQIIADDEAPSDGKTERERYTYPEGHSNSNETLNVEDALTEKTLAMDMEAALQAELEGAVETDKIEVAKVKEKISLDDKAAQVRAELSSVSADLIADERIAQYRSDGKLQIETLAAAKAEEKAKATATPIIATPIPVFAPLPVPKVASVATTPILPTTNAIAQEMATTMMNEKSGEIQALLSDLMRPTIRKWLSDNLPTMVEKLVREEIQAASRGRKANS